MACARKDIIRAGEYGIYHCTSRCVRRAFLMGVDRYTGIDYSHRRDWALERLELLVANFAIDVGFFAIMSNHLHLVLRTIPRLIERLGTWEIARRWLRMYPGKRVLDGQWIEPTEEQVKKLAENKKEIHKIRKRLSSISWFMATLSEYLARRANREDDVTGRFWQGRFASREVTDEPSLLACGLYVDLNPIRAGEVAVPENMMYSSLGLRLDRSIEEVTNEVLSNRPADWLAPLTLESDQLGDMPSASGRRASDKGLLPMTVVHYARLLDWVGRGAEPGKSGAIPEDLAPILERLGIVSEQFVATVLSFPKWFPRFSGRVSQFTERAKAAGKKWFQGVRHAGRAFR